MQQKCNDEGKLNSKIDRSIGFANDLVYARKSIAIGAMTVDIAIEFLELEEGRSFDSTPALQLEILVCLENIEAGRCNNYPKLAL